jgi:hypothetical protein
MPFRSRAQLRKCYVLQGRARKLGLRSSWDCHKWYHAGPSYSRLPERLHKKRHRRKR